MGSEKYPPAPPDHEREHLRRGDAFVKVGDTHSAVKEYLSYCEYLEHHPPAATLKVAAVRKQVLMLLPDRRDVRRSLAENYVQLGLVDEARTELRRLISEWEAAGNQAARAEVLARLEKLSPSPG